MLDTQDTTLSRLLRDAALPMVAARIRRARKDSGLSHDAIAKRMGQGATRQHLIKLEKGMHRPTPDTLERYAEATGHPAEWFVSPGPSPFQEA